MLYGNCKGWGGCLGCGACLLNPQVKGIWNDQLPLACCIPEKLFQLLSFQMVIMLRGSKNRCWQNTGLPNSQFLPKKQVGWGIRKRMNAGVLLLTSGVAESVSLLALFPSCPAELGGGGVVLDEGPLCSLWQVLFSALWLRLHRWQTCIQLPKP